MTAVVEGLQTGEKADAVSKTTSQQIILENSDAIMGISRGDDIVGPATRPGYPQPALFPLFRTCGARG